MTPPRTTRFHARVRRSRVARVAAVAALGAFALTAPARAQTWRTFDAARQLRDATALAVKVTYGAGRLSIAPGSERTLFDVHMRYDADRAEPIYQYDASAKHLEVGVKFQSKVRHNLRGKDAGELAVALTRSVPVDLDLEVGAAQMDLDFGGVQLESLALKTGAAEAQMRFSAPNPRTMRAMRIEAGAASVTASQLGNANVERMEVSMGAGSITLDFAGAWNNDVALQVNSAIGSVKLHVPRDVAVRVETSTFLYSVSGDGLTKRGRTWTSDNTGSAKRTLSVKVSGALGSLEVVRLGR